MRICHLSAVAAAVALVFAAPFANVADASADYTYSVKRGDTVIGISEKHLLDPKQWREVARYNRMKNPSRVMPGEALRIPLALARAKPSTITVAHVEGDVKSATGKGAPPGVLALGATLA